MTAKPKTQTPIHTYTFFFYDVDDNRVDHLITKAESLKDAVYTLLEYQAERCEEEESSTKGRQECLEDFTGYAYQFYTNHGKQIAPNPAKDDRSLIGIHINDTIASFGLGDSMRYISTSGETPENVFHDLAQYMDEGEYDKMVAYQVANLAINLELSQGTKPPLGILNRKLWIEKRLHDLQRTMLEYHMAGHPWNPAWATEEQELIAGIEAFNKTNSED